MVNSAGVNCFKIPDVEKDIIRFYRTWGKSTPVCFEVATAPEGTDAAWGLHPGTIEHMCNDGRFAGKIAEHMFNPYYGLGIHRNNNQPGSDAFIPSSLVGFKLLRKLVEIRSLTKGGVSFAPSRNVGCDRPNITIKNWRKAVDKKAFFGICDITANPIFRLYMVPTWFILQLEKKGVFKAKRKRKGKKPKRSYKLSPKVFEELIKNTILKDSIWVYHHCNNKVPPRVVAV